MLPHMQPLACFLGAVVFPPTSFAVDYLLAATVQHTICWRTCFDPDHLDLETGTATIDSPIVAVPGSSWHYLLPQIQQLVCFLV